jgi:hypothetical protein
MAAPEWLLHVSGIEPFDEPGFQSGLPVAANYNKKSLHIFPAKAGK